MQRTRTTLLASLLLTSACAIPMAPAPAPAPVPPEGPAAHPEPAPTLRTLDWLSGHWRVESQGGATEELWMPGRGGLSLGLNRDVRVASDGTQRTAFEYLRIEERASGLVYVAQPAGGAPTEFALTEADDRHAVFENLAHDFPQRIEYRLAESDAATLVVSATTAGRGPTWTLRRIGSVL